MNVPHGYPRGHGRVQLGEGYFCVYLDCQQSLQPIVLARYLAGAVHWAAAGAQAHFLTVHSAAAGLQTHFPARAHL